MLVVTKHYQRQISQSSHLQQTVQVKGLNDNGDGSRGISDITQAISFKNIEEHLSDVPPFGKLVIVILELNIEADLGLAVLSARSIFEQHLDVLNHLVHRDNLVSIIEHG